MSARAGAADFDFGWLRRVTPISSDWGLDRGLPIDRYYIERFLESQAPLIRGRVLEFGNDKYTRRFGRDVEIRDVWNVVGGDPLTTIEGDLTAADFVPGDLFDCIICTQTLQLIFDVRSALATLARILRPGGVLLATVPGISQISRFDMDRWGDYWRFTTASARRLVERFFPPPHVRVGSYGNVLAAVAFSYGLAAVELTTEELDHHDPRFPVVLAVAATKSSVAGRGDHRG